MTKSLYWLFKKFPEEADLIGRMVMGYGEMEFHLAWCVTHVIDDEDTAFKVIFRAPGEVARILAADALARLKISDQRLRTLFEQAIAGLHHCRKIRNQYAHCHWLDEGTQIGFLEFEDVAAQHTPVMVSRVEVRYIDKVLLTLQEGYFFYVYETLAYLNFEYQLIRGLIPTSPVKEAPRTMPPPKLYN
jgi:hypothetical protein